MTRFRAQESTSVIDKNVSAKARKGDKGKKYSIGKK